MTILNNCKRSSACFGFVLASSLLWAQSAAAEVTLVEKDGWTFFADGQINAFVSTAFGDDFPQPTAPADPTFGTHLVMGSNKIQQQPAGFGWLSSTQQDAEGKLFAMRVRSGLFSNVLGFGLKRDIDKTTSVKGFIGIWAPIESLGRDKWQQVFADVREGYFDIDGPWGTVTAGRFHPFVGRTSYDIDVRYAHGYGLGLPCSDDIGPACGQAGAGALHPGYAAGFAYATPSMGGLKLHLGIFDPVRYPNLFERVPLVRPEGALTFDAKFNGGEFGAGVEGLYQGVSTIDSEDTDMDPLTPDVRTERSDKVWAVSGGARVEIGPVRIGAAGFHGRGIGLYTVMQTTQDATFGPGVTTDMAGNQTLDPDHPELRTSTGFHGHASLKFNRLTFGAGGGLATVGTIPSDQINASVSVGRAHIGVMAEIHYEVSDSVVVGLDYMRFMATWRGAPEADAAGLLTGNVMAAEKQDLNFVNAGATYHW